MSRLSNSMISRASLGSTSKCQHAVMGRTMQTSPEGLLPMPSFHFFCCAGSMVLKFWRSNGKLGARARWPLNTEMCSGAYTRVLLVLERESASARAREREVLLTIKK